MKHRVLVAPAVLLPGKEAKRMKLSQIARVLICSLLVLGTTGAGIVLADAAPPVGKLTLWYQQPAKRGMNEGWPIGNGTFGGLIYAGLKQERVVLNEISLWTGSEISSDDYSKMGSYCSVSTLCLCQTHAVVGDDPQEQFHGSSPSRACPQC